MKGKSLATPIQHDMILDCHVGIFIIVPSIIIFNARVDVGIL